MDSSPSPDTHRNKCAACFRQFNKMEHLVEHMRTSHHSAHEPTCGVCRKHCRSFDSLRDHLIGSLPKVECRRVFAAQGCHFCLKVFDTTGALRAHRASCQLSRGPNMTSQMSRLSMQGQAGSSGVVALGCKMVGGGSDGSLDLCARVCLVGEDENIIFHTYVKPHIPVTHYRYETTGIRPEQLRDSGMQPKQAQRRVQELLLNGEQPWKVRASRGRARILVGHGLDHDLHALGIEYPSYLTRDTAKYPPLMKTSKLSNSLKYLTQTYLGYDIQIGLQNPYDDCVATLRLYSRMRAQPHQRDGQPSSDDAQGRNSSSSSFPSWRQRELEGMSPEELLHLSTSDYYCWCLDA